MITAESGSDAGTPALRRGLALLRQLSGAPEGLSAADLAARLAVPRATLYRLLRALLDEEFVMSGGDDGR